MESSAEHKNPIEIWGGVECTVARIRNSVYDQLRLNGHEERPADAELFASLGIRTLRYPLLWEKYEQDHERFFSLHDVRLQLLKKFNIQPIAGLLHHGSGPFFTGLDDPRFPELFAEYAFQIAGRYPWINRYTPINEPLTTARFSGLYGIWYPHQRSNYSFAGIFLNEMRAIVLAMQKMRKVNPAIQLVQTEDLCKVHSTETLKYQADFENERRWLTCDVLTGKLNRDHPLWEHFIAWGILEKDLAFFWENQLTPEVCGFNYYMTSERFLDHRLQDYPACYHGGNGIHRYADIEASRANIPYQINSGRLLEEAWQRYHLPLALTEVHLAGPVEKQLNWFLEAWENALSLKKKGIDIRAITAWALLGSFDWDSLLCLQNNNYEPGVYDIRSGIPVATALAGMIRDLNRTGSFSMQLEPLKLQVT